MDFLSVKAGRMLDDVVLAEMFSVIGSHDHEGVLQDPAVLQLLQQLPYLIIEIEETLVIAIDQVRQLVGRWHHMTLRPDIERGGSELRSHNTEATLIGGGGDIGRVHIHVVQEREEWTGPGPIEPSEKLPVDVRCPLATGNVHPT